MWPVKEVLIIHSQIIIAINTLPKKAKPFFETYNYLIVYNFKIEMQRTWI